MTHTNIAGMTCDNCKSKVENALNTIDGVEAVSFKPTDSHYNYGKAHTDRTASASACDCR